MLYQTKMKDKYFTYNLIMEKVNEDAWKLVADEKVKKKKHTRKEEEALRTTALANGES